MKKISKFIFSANSCEQKMPIYIKLLHSTIKDQSTVDVDAVIDFYADVNNSDSKLLNQAEKTLIAI